jgi:hypothetical protein
MVPEEYRTINHAICLLPDEHQDAREAARTALHSIFREYVRLVEERSKLRRLTEEGR